VILHLYYLSFYFFDFVLIFIFCIIFLTEGLKEEARKRIEREKKTPWWMFWK